MRWYLRVWERNGRRHDIGLEHQSRANTFLMYYYHVARSLACDEMLTLHCCAKTTRSSVRRRVQRRVLCSLQYGKEAITRDVPPWTCHVASLLPKTSSSTGLRAFLAIRMACSQNCKFLSLPTEVYERRTNRCNGGLRKMQVDFGRC